MKTKSRKLIKRSIISLLALMTTAALASSSLCAPMVFAEPDESSVSEESNDISGNGDDDSGGIMNEDDDPVDDEEDDSGGLKIYKDGEELNIEISSNEEWEDDTITGSTDPVNEAPSVEEYNKNKEMYDVPDGDNLYTLTVSSGINGGDSVEYIAVRYTDVNGTNQTKYIFTTEERWDLVKEYLKNYSYEKTVTMIQRMGSTTNEIENVITVSPFQDSLSGSNVDHSTLNDMKYTVNEADSNMSYLNSWSADELLFKTKNEIRQVNSIDVFMSDGKWSVQGMSISKVSKVGGYAEYGYYSGKYYLALEKEQICYLKSKKSGTQTFSATGDTMLNIGGSSSIYYSLEQGSDSADTDSGRQFDDLYTFRFDFADSPEYGIESLLKTEPGSPMNGPVAEHLAYEINYKDKNGWTRTVTMPVLLSALGQYDDKTENSEKVHTMGLCQQGDTIAFTANLPEFSSMKSTKLYVGSAAREAIESSGGIKTTGSSDERTELIKSLDDDYVSISGISVYEGTCIMSNTEKGKDPQTGDEYTSCTIVFDFQNDEPIFYNTTTSADGTRISPGASESFKLDKYVSGNPIIAAERSENILVGLKTGDVYGAEPNGTVRIKLTYQNSSGTETTTKNFSVSDETKNYYGYWPTTIYAKDNFGYTYGTRRGGTLYFPLSISEISAITNVQITLGADADEWQLEGVSVSTIDSIGARRIYAQNLTGSDDHSSYRIVRSTDKTEIPPFAISFKALFSPGDTYNISTGTGSVKKSSGVDYESVRYYMTYEQSKDDYGFGRSKKTYDVNVKVADDPDEGNENGDSGSDNYFYFQLRFKRGNSAYVLANQQLSSDGFRAGCNELFSVSINRDYGDLTGVRVIPQDVTDDSDVFDKLNIEKITVTEQTSGGTAEQYVFDNIGWIGIDYHDKSQDNAVKAREGRTVSELASSFSQPYKQQVINLLCEITTLPWDSDYDQVEGSIACDLDYIDTDGEPQTLGFDVVSRMYSYMNKTPKAYDGRVDGDNASVYANMNTVSDPKWMLRPNHTDRFIIPSLADVKSVSSMTFYATSRNNKTGKWVIGGVEISRIESDSAVVTLTSNNEYYRTMETTPLCEMDTSTGKEKVTLTLPAGSTQKASISLTDNTITWSEDKTEVSSVSTFPDSNDDTINVYIIPSSLSDDITNVTTGITVQYTISNSRIMQIKQNSLHVKDGGTSKQIYYYTGLDVSDMKSISSLSISCRDSGVLFDKAIIQQVRDGVIVQTFNFSFGGASAILGLSASPASTTKIYDQNLQTKQSLMISLGPKTKEMSLFGKTDDNQNPNDIAVCLKYKSMIDPTGAEYYTPYVYLTESGISKIYPGYMATVSFDVDYVSEITGYRIASYGSIEANVQGALAINYNYTTSESGTKSTTRKNVCSFSQKFDTTSNPTEKKGVSGMTGYDTVNPLDVNFVTEEAEEGAETGVNEVVAAEFIYKNHMGKDTHLVLKDLRQYIQSTSKQFKTGSTSRVRLFMPECKELTSIKITTTENNWKVSEISGSYQLGEQQVNRKLNMVFTPEGETISLKNVTLSTNISVDGVYKGLVTNNQKNIKASGGSVISGTVTVSNSDKGFDMRVDLLTNGIETDITDECSTKTDKKFEVTVPENYSSVAEQYSITVWPEENPGIKDVINITVPVPGSSSGNQDDNTENSRYEPQEQSENSEYEPEESYNETSEWPEPEEPSYEPDFPDESYDDESEFPFESREESESEMSEPVTEDETSEISETTSVPSEEESSSIP